MVHFTVQGTRPAETEETQELASDAETGLDGRHTEDALFVGRFGARANVSEGGPVEVSVDTSSMHFFDPETGLGIYDQKQGKGAAS